MGLCCRLNWAHATSRVRSVWLPKAIKFELLCRFVLAVFGVDRDVVVVKFMESAQNALLCLFLQSQKEDQLRDCIIRSASDI